MYKSFNFSVYGIFYSKLLKEGVRSKQGSKSERVLGRVQPLGPVLLRAQLISCPAHHDYLGKFFPFLLC